MLTRWLKLNTIIHNHWIWTPYLSLWEDTGRHFWNVFLHPRWVARSGSLMVLPQKRPGNHGMFCRFGWQTNPIVTPLLLQPLQEQCRRVADVFEACGELTFVGFGWSWHIMAMMILIVLKRKCTKKGHKKCLFVRHNLFSIWPLNTQQFVAMLMVLIAKNQWGIQVKLTPNPQWREVKRKLRRKFSDGGLWSMTQMQQIGHQEIFPQSGASQPSMVNFVVSTIQISV